MADTATRSRPLAPITGASGGIGLELAKQAAAHRRMAEPGTGERNGGDR